jgi:predicted Rossmann fold flavoprotein
LTSVDVVVVGAGAAGMFCAAEAGRRGRRVVVLEHNGRPGKKIRISGGGRCNFTNLHSTHANFLSANPHFAKSALARYTPADFVRLVRAHRIPFHEKKLGQLFCDGSAQEIIDMLVEECVRAGVSMVCECAVSSVARGGEGFVVRTTRGEFACESLVVATGGLSVAQLGATDFGYRVARQFGLRVRATRPGLVPFTLGAEELERFAGLSGVSLDAVAACNGAEFRENVLVTHRGLSGPAVLQVSSYWSPGDEVTINLLPHSDASDWLAARRDRDATLANLLAQHLPRRFAHAWCEANAPARPLRRYTSAEVEETAERLRAWRVLPAGTEGYRKAEVTVGGVDTDELSSKTMEARKVPGLYFIGEVVDVTGHLGGHNFQWAWSSGFAAGQAA